MSADLLSSVDNTWGIENIGEKEAIKDLEVAH